MFPFARFRVDDHSMEPGLHPGDYVIVNTWAYRKRPPAAGDIVVLRNPEAPSQFLVKRVASVSPAGGVVVVGDNATVSRDSRHFGPVARDLIVGKVRAHATE